MPLSANITLASFLQVGRGPLVDREWERTETLRLIDQLDIRVDSPDRLAGTLSGGNQQKVTLGRWMCAEARILIMDDPTRGIDVGAKAEVFRLVRRLADEGSGILYGTTELGEARDLGHRILVMSAGRLVAEFDPTVSEHQIMEAAGGLNG